MKLRTITSLLIVLVLTACGGHSSVLSSDSRQINSSEKDSSFSSISAEISSSSSEESTRPSYNEDTSIHAYDDYYLDVQSWENGEDLKQKLKSL